MGVLRRIRRVIQDFRSPVPIRHGHVYIDELTGEPVEITSVGRNVHLVRQDADDRPENTVYKTEMRSAIKQGFLTHDAQRCPECRDDMY